MRIFDVQVQLGEILLPVGAVGAEDPGPAAAHGVGVLQAPQQLDVAVVLHPEHTQIIGPVLIYY